MWSSVITNRTSNAHTGREGEEGEEGNLFTVSGSGEHWTLSSANQTLKISSAPQCRAPEEPESDSYVTPRLSLTLSLSPVGQLVLMAFKMQLMQLSGSQLIPADRLLLSC